MPPFQDLGHYQATSYGPPWGGIQGSGQATACGYHLGGGAPKVYAVAADPALPCGTYLFIWPNPFGHAGPFVVWDRGGAIGSKRLDFYDWRGRSRQLGWGRKDVRVWKVRTGSQLADFHIGPVNVPTPDAPIPGILKDLIPQTGPFGLPIPIPGIPGGGGGGGSGDLIPSPGIPGVDQLVQVLNGILAPAQAIAQFFKGLGELFLTPEGWLRIGKILLGVVAVLWGFNILVRDTTGADIAGGAKKAAVATAGAATVAA